MQPDFLKLDSGNHRARKMSLTPLIDVVFLLLIFFMLASTFSKFTTLPLAVASKSQSVTSPKNIVLMRIDENGAMEINGQTVANDDVIAALNTRAKNPESRLIIKPKPGVSVQQLVTAMDLAKRSNIKATSVVN